ncbi:3-phosphoshikimate 1-carboxyvinyltransferase [archaeon]|nr:3-phosphoshikimate 1-carboxyvinyltransferase [archaeon]
MAIEISHLRNTLLGKSGRSQEGNLCIKKTLSLNGTIDASPSKSYTHRAVIIGSMNGQSKIVNFLESDDTRRTIEAWRQLGAKIERDSRTLNIHGFNGKPVFKSSEIDVGESGTLLRFILSIIPLGQGKIVIDGGPTLRTRPNKMIVNPLKKLNVFIETATPDGEIPITVNSTGRIEGGEIEVDGYMSSQVISSLLISLPLAEKDTIIHVKDSDKLVSRPYINVTLDVLDKAGIKDGKDIKYDKDFGTFEIKGNREYKPLGNYTVHGDYSSSAFIMAAACLTSSDVTITDLVDDKQGDMEIISILRRMGAEVKKNKSDVHVNGPFKLSGVEVDCRDTPDLVPVIAALGVFAKGETRIYNIKHLRYKESNRIDSIQTEFRKLGISIKTTENEITVKKSTPKKGLILDPHRDHRIAMALSLIGLKSGNLGIRDPACIEKSYPDFINHLQRLGAHIEIK